MTYWYFVSNPAKFSDTSFVCLTNNWSTAARCSKPGGQFGIAIGTFVGISKRQLSGKWMQKRIYRMKLEVTRESFSREKNDSIYWYRNNYWIFHIFCTKNIGWTLNNIDRKENLLQFNVGWATIGRGIPWTCVELPFCKYDYGILFERSVDLNKYFSLIYKFFPNITFAMPGRATKTSSMVSWSCNWTKLR